MSEGSSQAGDAVKLARGADGRFRLAAAERFDRSAGLVLVNQEAARKAALSKKITQLKALYSKKAYGEALVLAQEVYAEAQALYGADSSTAAGSAFNLGTLYRLTGQPDKAIPVLEASLAFERAHSSPANAGHTRVLNELARAHKAKGPSGKPVALYLEAIEELRKEAPEQHAALSTMLVRLGIALRAAGQLEEAETAQSKALALKTKLYGEKSDELVAVLSQLAGVQRLRGKFDAAEDSYRRAIANQRALKKDPDVTVAILLDNLAVLYNSLGRRSDAEPLQKEALQIAEAALGYDHHTVGQIVANLASLRDGQSRNGEAEALYRRALEIYRKSLPAGNIRFGILYSNLGGVYREQNRNELARQTFRKALENILLNYPENHPEVATALNNLALSEKAAGEHDRAVSLFKRSMEITRQTQGVDHSGYAVALANLGDAQSQAGDLEGARHSLIRALQTIDKVFGEGHARSLYPLRDLGWTEYRGKNYAKAADYFARAARVEQQNLDRNPGDGGLMSRGVFSGYRYALWRAGLTKQMAVEEATHRAFEAVQWTSLTRAGDAISKMGARLSAGDAKLASLIRERQDLREAWEAGDAALFEAASKPPAQRDKAREQSLRQRLKETKAKFERADERLIEAFPEYAQLARPRPLSPKQASAHLRRDEVMIVFHVGASILESWLVDPSHSDNAMIWRRKAIERAKVRQLVHAVRCGLDQGEWVGELKPLKCLQAVGAMPEKGVLPFHGASARELYKLLIEPFAGQIGDRHMILVADDALSSLPFHVLLKEDLEGKDYASAKWLGLNNPISVLPSVSALRTLRRDARVAKGRLPYLGVANPLLTGADGKDRSAWAKQACPRRRDGNGLAVALLSGSAVSAMSGAPVTLVRGAGGDIDVAAVRKLIPLPETADEVCRVAETVGADEDAVVLGEKARESEIKRLSRDGTLADYRVLHFATHGLVAGELSALAEPALVMTPPDKASGDDNGLLTATEVAGLKLDADWVVLSACNTAAGDELGAEALSGLARSFFYAGARSMLVSHWPVQSDAAVELTTFALAELRKDAGVGRAEALRRAMAGMVRKPESAVGAHPQVWAPFVVVGEGGALGPAAPVAGATPDERGHRFFSSDTTKEAGDIETGSSRSAQRGSAQPPGPAEAADAGEPTAPAGSSDGENESAEHTVALVPSHQTPLSSTPEAASVAQSRSVAPGAESDDGLLPVRKPAVPQACLDADEARKKAAQQAAAAAQRARMARERARRAAQRKSKPDKPWGHKYWEQNL